VSNDSHAAGPSGPGPVIVVADGNADAAESLAVVLRLHGFTVEVAFTGREALSLVLDRRPLAAILTLALPHLNGFEVARQIGQAIPDTERPLLIALTGYGRDEDRNRTRQAGFDYHVLKPAEPEQLIDLIRKSRADLA
jgi:DNA-binding response OmpR family regulator